MRSFGFEFLLILVIYSGVSFLSCEPLPHQETAALMALKRGIMEDPLSVLSNWNARSGEPCNWYGVICSESRDHVITLNLSRSSLKGYISPELGLMSSLKELILNDNNFVGTIPNQIGMLKNLLVLDLSANHLTGPIPTEIGLLTSIKKLNLRYNGLTGYIPSSIGKLLNIVELRLDRNRLVGPILGASTKYYARKLHHLSTQHNSGNNMHFCLFPQLKVGDFSYNFLVGKVPSCLKYLPRPSFQGNCLLDEYAILQRAPQICGFPKGQREVNDAPRHSSKEYKHQMLQQPVWLFILEGCIVVLLFITLAATAYMRSYQKLHIQLTCKRVTNWSKHVSISIDDGIQDISSFNWEELELACENFSNIIGSSQDSIVYKGNMKNELEIAVISPCISKDQWNDDLELLFDNKVADLARLNHENAAKLLGYCKQNSPFSRLLVFEYAAYNGTLYEHLHYGEDIEGGILSWFKRMKICLGIARCLKYLHTEMHPPIALSELNSSAVFLTENCTPRVVYFESWKRALSKVDDSSGRLAGGDSSNNLVASTENFQHNTYAFGVLLLEIISRRHPFCKEGGCLADWAAECLQNPSEMGRFVDPELKFVNAGDLEVIYRTISLCTDPDPTKRPSMQTVAALLQNGIDISMDGFHLACLDLTLSS